MPNRKGFTSNTNDFMQSTNRTSSCITLTEEELVFCFVFLIKSSMSIRLFQTQVIFSVRTVLAESFAIVSLSTGIVVSSRCFCLYLSHNNVLIYSSCISFYSVRSFEWFIRSILSSIDSRLSSSNEMPNKNGFNWNVEHQFVDAEQSEIELLAFHRDHMFHAC